MNAEQIIKALDCCCVVCYCNTCPYYKVGEHTQVCTRKMAKDVLALIKEQEQKIFELENRLKECENGYEGTLYLDRCKLHDAEEKIKELTQAHEMLSESYDHLEKTKDELLAERSRLTEENERLMRDKTALECIVSTARNQAKADTVRKMQERLKKELRSGNAIMDKSIADIIDQIAKEIINESTAT